MNLADLFVILVQMHVMQMNSRKYDVATLTLRWLSNQRKDVFDVKLFNTIAKLQAYLNNREVRILDVSKKSGMKQALCEGSAWTCILNSQYKPFYDTLLM